MCTRDIYLRKQVPSLTNLGGISGVLVFLSLSLSRGLAGFLGFSSGSTFSHCCVQFGSGASCSRGAPGEQDSSQSGAASAVCFPSSPITLAAAVAVSSVSL